MLNLLELFIQLLDLAVGKVKFLLSTLNVSQHVGLRLVCFLKKSLVQLHICLLVLHFILESQDLSLQGFSLLLLLLEPVCQQKTLLDAPLGSGWCVGNGLNESVADIVRSITLDLIVLCHVHNSLVEFFLDHLVVGQSFSGHCKFCLDVSVSLASTALELVVFGLEHVQLGPERLILEFGLLDKDHVVFIEVLDSCHSVLFSSNIELELSQFVISRLLEGTEFKYELLVVLALITKVRLELVDAALLLVLAFSQVFDLPLVDISKVLLCMLKFLGLTVLELLDLFRVLGLKLGLDIIVGGEDSIHVLFSLFLGIEEAELGSVNFVFETLDFLLKIGVLTAQEVLVLVEQVDLSAKTLVTSLNIDLGLL